MMMGILREDDYQNNYLSGKRHYVGAIGAGVDDSKNLAQTGPILDL